MVASRVLYAGLFFTLAMALVYVSKPQLLFQADKGEPRPFNATGKDGGTIFPIGVVTAVIAVLSIAIFAVIDLVYA